MQTERVAGPVPGFAASRPVSFSVTIFALTAGWCCTSVVAFAAAGCRRTPSIGAMWADSAASRRRRDIVLEGILLRGARSGNSSGQRLRR